MCCGNNKRRVHEKLTLRYRLRDRYWTIHDRIRYTAEDRIHQRIARHQDARVSVWERRLPQVRDLATGHSEWDSKSVAIQRQSLLFAMLPIEIRRNIYMYAFGDEPLHIVVANEEEPVTDQFSLQHSGMQHALGFVKSCKLAYMEAIHLFYTASTFSFDNMTAFACFQRLVTPDYLHAIQSMHLTWGGPQSPSLQTFLGKDITPPNDPLTWQKTCHDMAEMQGLKHLKIDMVVYKRWPGQVSLEDTWELVLFPHLEAIRGVEDFDVCVTWGGEDFPIGHPSTMQWPFAVRRGVVSLWRDFGYGLGVATER